MDCATGPPHRSAELYWKRPDDPISLTDRHESASARQTVVSESGVRKHRVRVRFYQELGAWSTGQAFSIDETYSNRVAQLLQPLWDRRSFGLHKRHQFIPMDREHAFEIQ